jgi:hypothetical protein
MEMTMSTLKIVKHGALVAIALSCSGQIAFAQTGKCMSATETVRKANWDAISYKYSPQYIEDNRAELQKAVDGAASSFKESCDKVTPSDEQILLQGALDIAAAPIKLSADTLLKGMGLPPLGDKAFHIDVKDIDEHGIFGGPNSVFRKPFG